MSEKKLTPPMTRVISEMKGGQELHSFKGKYWLQGSFTSRVPKAVANALGRRGLIKISCHGQGMRNSRWELTEAGNAAIKEEEMK